MFSDFDPFAELGLSPSAALEPEVVKAAFKALAKKYHPDNFGQGSPDKTFAEEKMRRLNEAKARILSGDYMVQPSTSLGVVSEPESLAVEAITPKEAFVPPILASEKKKRSYPISTLSIAAAFAIVFIAITLPGFLSSYYLRQAERLEDQGQLEQAIELTNKATDSDSRNGKAFLVRARLAAKLGYPKRAEVDLLNAKGLVSDGEWQRVREQVEDASDGDSATTREMPGETPTPFRREATLSTKGSK